MKKLSNEEARNLEAMGEVLMVWREKKGMSRFEVSKRTGLNPQAIRNIEEGRDVSLSTFLAYAELFLWQMGEKFDAMSHYLVYRNIHSQLPPREVQRMLEERIEFSKRKEINPDEAETKPNTYCLQA